MRAGGSLVIATALAIAGGAHAAPAQGTVAAPPKSAAAAVDRLLAPWNSTRSPGAVVAVIDGGRIVFSRGYGMADIERRRPNTPATVFHIASMSKQFTAFGIHLLASQGKLSLSDNVGKYLPELGDLGRKVTIAQLLHHTSGLRDQWTLWRLAGHRIDDEIPEEDLLDLIWRQHDLNFEPGSRFLYSNTGYTLLAQIVARVSGQPFASFLKQKIFDPLGMRDTHVQTDYGTLVTDRASSYLRNDDGSYRYFALSYSNYGATSLFTTVRDFARWDQNFYSPVVGDAAVIAAMQTKGRLNDGHEIDYASGLEIGDYRGLKTVEHGGGDAGFRTDALRFPGQHFTVVIFANAGDIDTAALARQVADIYLAHDLGPPPAKREPTLKPVKLTPAQLQAMSGTYEVEAASVLLTFSLDGDRMTMTTSEDDDPQAVVAASPQTLFVKDHDASITFELPGADGSFSGGVLRAGGASLAAKRISTAPLTPDKLAAYQGVYYSDELGVLYTVTSKDGDLFVRTGETTRPLARGVGDTFFAPPARIDFDCVSPTRCDGLKLDAGRVLRLKFRKVALVPTAPAP